jgi:hypothetical protein
MARGVIESELTLITEMTHVMVKFFGQENTLRYVELMRSEHFSDEEFERQKKLAELQELRSRLPLGMHGYGI